MQAKKCMAEPCYTTLLSDAQAVVLCRRAVESEQRAERPVQQPDKPQPTAHSLPPPVNAQLARTRTLVTRTLLNSTNHMYGGSSLSRSAAGLACIRSRPRYEQQLSLAAIHTYDATSHLHVTSINSPFPMTPLGSTHNHRFAVSEQREREREKERERERVLLPAPHCTPWCGVEEPRSAAAMTCIRR